MASISAVGSYGHHKFTLTVTEGTPNNTANTSPVSFTFKISPVATSWNWSSWGDSISYTVTINGTKYTGTIPSYDGYSTVTLESGSQTITHSDDGSKTISYSFVVDDNANGKNSSGKYYTPGDASASGTLKLTTIPRATSIDSLTCSTSYLNGTLTYKYTPKSASYYNRVNISLNLSGTYIAIRSINLGKKATSQQTGTVTFTDDELTEIYADLPSATKGNIRFTLRTYSDSGYSTQIGNAAYKEVELTIPTSVKPTASLAVTMVNDNAWIAGKKIYVAGFSKATLKLTASPGSGSSLKTTNISGDGLSQDTTSLTVQFATGGDFDFTGKATDKRDRSASDSESITVLPYSAPSVLSLQVERGTYSSGWTAKDDGADVKVTFNVALALSDNGNTYAATFEIDGETITPSAGSTTGLASKATRTVYIKNIESETSHLLTLAVSDSVGMPGGATTLVPTAVVTVEYNSSGKGAAFGKTSEKDAFECAFPAEFSAGASLIREDGSAVELGDTGWIDLGLSENVTESDNDLGRVARGCKYRVVNGNHVYVAFACAFTYSGSALIVSANKIPEALRPANAIYQMCATGGRALARCIAHYNGYIYVDWIQNIPTTETTTSTTVNWVDGYIDYWLD